MGDADARRVRMMRGERERGVYRDEEGCGE
jgi:hypothetical protein